MCKISGFIADFFQKLYNPNIQTVNINHILSSITNAKVIMEEFNINCTEDLNIQ